MPSFSDSLEQTIHFALALANDRSHEFATLEHLLLALTHELDAATALMACCKDIEELRARITKFIDSELTNLVTEIDGSEAVPTAAFQRVIQRAAIHVQSSGRKIVTGANVLVAIFAERESNAANFLNDQDVTRYDIVQFLAQGVAKFENYGVRAKADEKIIFKSVAEYGAESFGADRVVRDRRSERANVTLKVESDSNTLALLARSIELQLRAEITSLAVRKPNFRSDAEQKAFETHSNFLEELADSIGDLAEGLARLSSSSEVLNANDLAVKTLGLRDRVTSYLAENREEALFYCVKMPAMFGSIALFSAAGAHMITATPILMALFGGDRIVRLLNKEASV